ncbi:protein jag [Ruicaihuangia caeni]|uniref:R3H domain-containing nucleic acid-binding protein n=1 Tax=Ruicaihuangia caeni TaxID=3042517 RepID=A0AAW6TBY8_9MICO|nr:R3H domain-containing nucleic acid-binding protein [Klugiella sp. YN-L-19]MDI2099117.1 R3H domain-containing nucleic acid-binding protein [Klugiella sp. YN-L-19]
MTDLSNSQDYSTDAEQPPIEDEVAAEAVHDDALDGDSTDEGDIAADYIEELLDIADLDGDIEIEVRGDRTYVSVVAEDPESVRSLSSPDTVEALQELTRLAVQARTGEFSRLILDIGGSRDARASELQRLVDHAIQRIEGGAESASLPPMSSYERKLVHDFAGERGYSAESEGEGRDRHNVIRRA